LDQDLTVQEWIGRSSPGFCQCRRRGGSGFDNGGVLVVSGEDRLHDEIQHDEANSMVCITEVLVSYNSEGGPLELAGMAVMPRAWLGVVQEEVPGTQSSYQEVQDIEEITVAQ
jgi:hypothetical protein